MRNLILPLVLAATLPLSGCEDGPHQVYSPAPAGAGDKWNDGNTAGAVDPAKAGFGGVTGGTNKQEICTGAQKAARWAQMFKEKIAPPRFVAGLDLAGGDTWQGLTVEQAEQKNCQSASAGDVFGDGNLDNYWGDNGEVIMEYRISTRKALQVTLSPGYLGTMDFKSKDGTHSYSMGINTQIQKDGQPFLFDLGVDGSANFESQADELYRAMLATFAPGLPVAPAGVTCVATGRCITGTFGDAAYFLVPAIGWDIFIDQRTAPQPIPSIPTRMDIFPAKILSYSFANPILKLDAVGPTANAGKLGSSATPCVLKMGLDYKDFLADCVEVTGDPSKDMTEVNKLLGGLSHSTERFSFDVQGIDVNFSDIQLPANDIIHDKDVPNEGDISTLFVVDQNTAGTLLNDVNLTAGTFDLHGTGAVYKEYLRLVRSNILQLAGIADGPIANCLYPSPLPAAFDKNAFLAALPAYCTGFEGFVTPAPSTGAGDVNNLGPDNAMAINPGFQTGLKLGHQQVSFCFDANGDINTGYNSCTSGDTFSTSYKRVLSIFGKGNVNNLPIEVQDIRFYFKMWTQAFLKYMTVGDQNPVPDLSTVKLSTDDLFFDSFGSGQFETAEYIDRRFASKTQNPIDITIGADVKNGIFNDYEFSRDLYRGEEAIYSGMLENKADGLGQEGNALLSNVFGSPLLASTWHDSSAGKTAYYCATTLDPANCDGQTPPLDANKKLLMDDQGRPVLAPYKGAFTSTVFTLGSSQVQVMKTFDQIAQAQIQVPLFDNPYDTSGTPASMLTSLVPWAPKQPGIGFPVAQNGGIDKFISTYQLDLSGTTITANIDYDFVIDPSTGEATNKVSFLAVETRDFLGDVFVCRDPKTRDLLRVRMYTPVQNVLDFLANHPGSKDACGIIIRYSPYGNYADYVTSLTNGVRLGITQGGGFGRVVDVTLFVPGQ